MDGLWRPQSPDLSALHHPAADPQHNAESAPAPVHPQHQAYCGSVSHIHAHTHTNVPIHHGSVPPSTSPASSPPLHAQPVLPLYMPRGRPRDASTLDPEFVPNASPAAPAAPVSLPLAGNGVAAHAGSSLPPGAENIAIRNHFPVARIKRIMQADDDVGKVAQVTPVVVSKALELFMISLVTKAAAEARARNSKRVAAVHLKQAIARNEQFDFLNDIVSKVADAPEKNDADAMDMDSKKKRATGRRKKKTDADDDF